MYTSMAVRRVDLLQGTLDLLVLKLLGSGPNHGYGLASRIHQLSDDALRVEEGSLYPALYRMEEQGLIEVGVGPDREQPQGQVLPADAQGAHRRAGRARQLAAPVGRHHARCCARSNTERDMAVEVAPLAHGV